jgi:NAD(P)-dependent dehydrogenase (short-subunit alcohol dehydrogenase family)
LRRRNRRPHLEKSKQGAFVAISSISGSEACGYGSVAYGTMKAAMFFYVKSYARKVARHGIRANLVSPAITFFEGAFWDKVKHKNRQALPKPSLSTPWAAWPHPKKSPEWRCSGSARGQAS